MKPKVLIITYYWPPAGGPGVQRWLKFVKYLPEYGVKPIVYCPENPDYPLLDESLTEEVGPEVSVLKHKIFEPYKLASIFSKKKTKTIASGLINTKKQGFVEKLLLFIRGNFFIPDARKFWVGPSVRFLRKYIEQHQIETIITTGPPHSVHLIGRRLKRHVNVKWIADFRDPWTSIGYHKKLKLTARARYVHKKMERKVLQSADRLVVTSPTTQNEFRGITEQPISVITNGFDDVKVENQLLDKKFTLAHIGSLLTGRNPIVLWMVLAKLIKENEAFSSAFELKLIGAVSDDVLLDIKQSGLTNHINVVGYVSHEEARQAQFNAQVLLLIEIDSDETIGILPGKLFEYMQTGRPILAFGPEEADFKAIINKTNSGVVFGYDESNMDQLESTILNCFKQYQQGVLRSQAIGVQYYHRRNTTKQLVDLL